MRDGNRDEAVADSIGAPVLVVSQFTSGGDPTSGRRSSYQAAVVATRWSRPWWLSFADSVWPWKPADSAP